MSIESEAAMTGLGGSNPSLPIEKKRKASELGCGGGGCRAEIDDFQDYNGEELTSLLDPPSISLDSFMERKLAVINSVPPSISLGTVMETGRTSDSSHGGDVWAMQPNAIFSFPSPEARSSSGDAGVIQLFDRFGLSRPEENPLGSKKLSSRRKISLERSLRFNIDQLTSYMEDSLLGACEETMADIRAEIKRQILLIRSCDADTSVLEPFIDEILGLGDKLKAWESCPPVFYISELCILLQTLEEKKSEFFTIFSSKEKEFACALSERHSVTVNFFDIFEEAKRKYERASTNIEKIKSDHQGAKFNVEDTEKKIEGVKSRLNDHQTSESERQDEIRSLKATIKAKLEELRGFCQQTYFSQQS